MQASEVARLAELEDRHWWYAERRSLLRRSLRHLPPDGIALDVGAAAGGNTRVLRELGWRALAVEYGVTGSRLARERALDVVQADAEMLPVASSSVQLVTALDVIEHLEHDSIALEEMCRVLQPGGHALISAPQDQRLWSEHDVAVGHLRRYAREELRQLIGDAGFVVDSVWSWNVLLRPVVARRRQTSVGSDLGMLPWPVNAGLRAVVALERVLPLREAPGVSLFVMARKAS